MSDDVQETLEALRGFLAMHGLRADGVLATLEAALKERDTEIAVLKAMDMTATAEQWEGEAKRLRAVLKERDERIAELERYRDEAERLRLIEHRKMFDEIERLREALEAAREEVLLDEVTAKWILDRALESEGK